MEMTKLKYRRFVDRLYLLSSWDLLITWISFKDQSDRDFYECLRYVWTNSEGLSKNKETWLMMMKSPRPARKKWLMNKDEHDFLKRLPEIVTIYRGCSVNYVNGLSWTTDKKRAVWFGNRFNFGKIGKRLNNQNECCVVTGQVAKSDILAVFLEQNEFEVVCDPRKVKKMKKTILPHKAGDGAPCFYSQMSSKQRSEFIDQVSECVQESFRPAEYERRS